LIKSHINQEVSQVGKEQIYILYTIYYILYIALLVNFYRSLYFFAIRNSVPGHAEDRFNGTKPVFVCSWTRTNNRYN